MAFGGVPATRETPIRAPRNFTKASVVRVVERDRVLAVKTVRGRSRSVGTVIARFLLRREARALARLQHLDCVPRLERADANEIVTPWFDGETVRARARRGITPREADSVRAAIAKLHAAGFAHGDLSPRDVLVGERGALLVDFATSIGPSAPPLLGRVLARLLRARDRRRVARITRRALKRWRDHQLLLAALSRDVPLSS